MWNLPQATSGDVGSNMCGLNPGCYGNEGGAHLSQGMWRRNFPHRKWGFVHVKFANQLLLQLILSLSSLTCYDWKNVGPMCCSAYCLPRYQTGLWSEQLRNRAKWATQKNGSVSHRSKGVSQQLCTFLPKAGVDDALLSSAAPCTL